MSVVGGRPHTLELRDPHQPAISAREKASQRRKPLSRVLLGGTRNVGRDVSLGLAQADDDEDRRLRRRERSHAGHVGSQVPGSDRREPRDVTRALELVLHVLRVAVGIEAASDAQDLQIGLEGLDRTHQREQARSLAGLVVPLI